MTRNKAPPKVFVTNVSWRIFERLKINSSGGVIIMTSALVTNNRLDELTANIKIKLVENKVASNIFNRTINQNSVEIGQWLMQAKKLVPYKKWQIWLDSNFGMTKQAAGNYIRVAEKFGNLKNVFHFEDFQFAALIELTKMTPSELQNFLAENPTASTLSVRNLKAEIKKFLPPKSPARKSKAIKTVELQTVYQLPLPCFENLPPLPAQIKVEWLIPAPILDIATRAGVDISLDFSRNVKPVASGAIITKKFWEVESRLMQIADAVISTPPITFNRSDGLTTNAKCYIWFFGGVDALPFKVFGNLFYTQKSPRNSAGENSQKQLTVLLF